MLPPRATVFLYTPAALTARPLGGWGPHGTVQIEWVQKLQPLSVTLSNVGSSIPVRATTPKMSSDFSGTLQIFTFPRL